MKSWIKISFFPFIFLSSSLINSANLTTYVTEWSGYSSPDGQHAAYPFDDSYPSQYGSQQKISNPDMLDKMEKSDVIAYAFLQVWDSNSATSQKYAVPSKLGRTFTFRRFMG